jgi:hypothetical protein
MTSELGSNPWDALAPTNRTPRVLETREKSSRQTTWDTGSILPEVMPRDGIAFKWVRASVHGKDDKKTFQQRMYQGYTPVRAEEYPELAHEVRFTEKVGLVERGGLVLCSIPQEVVDDRRRQIAGNTRDQMESAEDDYMRSPHEAAQRLFKKKRETVFGR